jgi:hypothetical protein
MPEKSGLALRIEMGFSVALGGRGFAVVEQRSDQFKRLAGGNQRRSEAVPVIPPTELPA